MELFCLLLLENIINVIKFYRIVIFKFVMNYVVKLVGSWMEIKFEYFRYYNFVIP